MGAHDFSTYMEGRRTLQEAFREATDRARYEYGSDGYNGTISTVATAIKLCGPVPLEALHEIEREEWEKEHRGETGLIRKWESCAAVPVAADQKFSWRTKTVTVNIETDSQWGDHNELMNKVREKVGLKPGELLGRVESEEVSAKTRIDARATKGPTKTRYFVCEGTPGERGFSVLPTGPDGNGYQLQSAARKAAERWAEKQTRECGVVGLRVREDGSPLVNVGGVSVKKRYKVKVRIAAPKEHRDGSGRRVEMPVIGWHFFGLAAS